MTTGDEEFFDPDAEDELPPEIQREEETDQDNGTLRPSKIWVNPVPHITEALASAQHSMNEGMFESLTILGLAEALSIAIPERDVYDFVQWRHLDTKYGPVDLRIGRRLSPEHYMARMKVLRQIGKSLGMMGQVAAEGQPAKLLSLETLCAQVRRYD